MTFWNQVEIDFELNSLAWFLSEEGEHTLKVRKKMEKFSPNEAKDYKLSEKVGKDKKVKNKRKTLMQILNESKKN